MTELAEVVLTKLTELAKARPAPPSAKAGRAKGSASDRAYVPLEHLIAVLPVRADEAEVEAALAELSNGNLASAWTCPRKGRVALLGPLDAERAGVVLSRHSNWIVEEARKRERPEAYRARPRVGGTTAPGQRPRL